MIPQSHSLTLSKASAFSSTAHCSWRTSLDKPPNPATTSSAELVLPESIFPPRLQKMVTSLISSSLDYCSSLLPGLPASVHSPRPIQNCAVSLIPPKRKTDHIISLSEPLHWLLIPQGIQYKLKTLCCKCITHTAPSYLCDWLHLLTPSLGLRSASDILSLRIPRTRLSNVGSRTFSVFGPSA